MFVRHPLAGLLLALACLGTGPAGAAPEPQAALDALHVLSRVGYGPRPGDIQAVLATPGGARGWLEKQLDPGSIPESPALLKRLEKRSTLKLTLDEKTRALRAVQADDRQGMSPDANTQNRSLLRQIQNDDNDDRLLSATLSDRQLQQKLREFWFNHFNIYKQKIFGIIWIGSYEREAIAPYTLGKFSDLLAATAHHPAMLNYLDNAQSAASELKGVKGAPAGLNENYARELLELHTLGVHGGYTQKDVRELARILTGWTIDPRTQSFLFQERWHDSGDKILLGKKFTNAGVKEGEDALRFLALQPATARFLSNKLAEFFIGDKPSPTLVAAMSRAYLKNDSDIRSTLHVLFASREFWQSPGKKFKTPYEYAISACRAAGIQLENPNVLMTFLSVTGQPLYGWQTPDGYKTSEAAWLVPEALTHRADLASRIVNNPGLLERPAGDTTTAEKPRPVSADTILQALAPAWSPHSLDVIQRAAPPLDAMLALSAPEMMRH